MRIARGAMRTARFEGEPEPFEVGCDALQQLPRVNHLATENALDLHGRRCGSRAAVANRASTRRLGLAQRWYRAIVRGVRPGQVYAVVAPPYYEHVVTCAAGCPEIQNCNMDPDLPRRYLPRGTTSRAKPGHDQLMVVLANPGAPQEVEDRHYAVSPERVAGAAWAFTEAVLEREVRQRFVCTAKRDTRRLDEAPRYRRVRVPGRRGA